MPTLSVAVMAHPSRRHLVPHLLDRLDVDATVVWDEGRGIWDTGRRALLAHTSTATHHVVLQDDTIVCRDLIAGLSVALGHVPDGWPVGLYYGRTGNGGRPQLEGPLRRAERLGHTWISHVGPIWGVGMVLPAGHIDHLVTWADGYPVNSYDSRVHRWYGQHPCWYPYPSLVDHHDVPSLVPGHGQAGERRAYRFIGEDASALDVDWSLTPRARKDTTMPKSDARIIAALLRERDAHLRHGRKGKAALVDEQLRLRGHADPEPPSTPEPEEKPDTAPPKGRSTRQEHQETADAAERKPAPRKRAPRKQAEIKPADAE